MTTPTAAKWVKALRRAARADVGVDASLDLWRSVQQMGGWLLTGLLVVPLLCVLGGSRHGLITVPPQAIRTLRAVLAKMLVALGLEYFEYVVASESTGEDLVASAIVRRQQHQRTLDAALPAEEETADSPIELDISPQLPLSPNKTTTTEPMRTTPWGPAFTAAMDQDPLLPRGAIPSVPVSHAMPLVVLLDSIQWASVEFQEELIEIMDGVEVLVEDEPVVIPKLVFIAIAVDPRASFASFPNLQSRLMDRFYVAECFLSDDQLGAVASTEGGAEGLIAPIFGREDLVVHTTNISQMFLSPQVDKYVRDILAGVRFHPLALAGSASAGAATDLYVAAKTLAYCLGSKYVAPHHVVHVVERILAHRVWVKSDVRLASLRDHDQAGDATPHEIIREALEAILPPV